MTIIIKSKTSFDITQIDDVATIAYNKATKIYTVTTANNVSTTYSSDSYYLSVFLI